MAVVRFKQASVPKVCRMNQAPRMSGFTMMELLVVITIVAILAGIGAPSFRNITTSYRIAGEVNGLLGDMQFARAEAIKEGQNVTICVSSDGVTCSTSSTAWQNGWTVFPAVATAPGAAQSAATVLRVQAAFSGSDTFVDHTSGTNTVTFDRNGLINGLTFGGALIALRDPTSNVFYTRCLQISSVGSLQVTQNNANGSCT
jgi:type IV fimbrial biogenesis protein FimT